MSQEPMGTVGSLVDGRAADPVLQFDYDALPPDAAAAAISTRDRIRSTMRASFIEIGQALIEAKGAMPHGAWGLWLRAEFSWTDRTAQSFMRAARWSEDKNEIIAVLPPTVVMALAAPSTPEPAVATVLQMAASGAEVSVKATKRIIAEEKDKALIEAERQAKTARRAKLTPEQQNKDDRRTAAIERSRCKQEDDLRRWNDDNERKKENAKRFADIIAPIISKNDDIIAMLSDINEFKFFTSLNDSVACYRYNISEDGAVKDNDGVVD
jgi:hypothetical protein